MLNQMLRRGRHWQMLSFRMEAEETHLLRSDVEALRDTGRSLMPEGMKKPGYSGDGRSDRVVDEGQIIMCYYIVSRNAPASGSMSTGS